MQTVWKGSISFGLVSIPVRLVGATEERDISFRQVHEADGGRIRYRRVCELDGKEVAYAEIAKGFELPDGDLVVLTDEDFADLPIASSKAVDVLGFVPFAEIDPTALSRAYYAEPTADAKPYVLLRDTLEESGRVAVVKIALRQRERLAVLRPRDGVLVVQTMLWPDEVRRPAFGFLDEGVTLRPQEVAMAQSYVDALSGDFDPADYSDGYRKALDEVVQAKIDGREVRAAEPARPDTGKVVDLMEALRRSVDEARRRRGEGSGGGGGEEPEEAEAEKQATSRRSTAKRTATKTTAENATANKATAKKAPAKKAAAKKAAATKTTARKPAAKKTTSKAAASGARRSA